MCVGAASCESSWTLCAQARPSSWMQASVRVREEVCAHACATSWTLCKLPCACARASLHVRLCLCAGLREHLNVVIQAFTTSWSAGPACRWAQCKPWQSSCISHDAPDEHPANARRTLPMYEPHFE